MASLFWNSTFIILTAFRWSQLWWSHIQAVLASPQQTFHIPKYKHNHNNKPSQRSSQRLEESEAIRRRPSITLQQKTTDRGQCLQKEQWEPPEAQATMSVQFSPVSQAGCGPVDTGISDPTGGACLDDKPLRSQWPCSIPTPPHCTTGSGFHSNWHLLLTGLQFTQVFEVPLLRYSTPRSSSQHR